MNQPSPPGQQSRQVAPIARAALAVLPALRLELEVMQSDAQAAARDLKSAGRTADAQRDLSERCARLAAEAAGAERIVKKVAALARG